MSQQAEEKRLQPTTPVHGRASRRKLRPPPHLAHVKEMKPSKKPFEFPDGPAITLPKTYAVDGVSKDLQSFLDETHTSALFVLKDGKVRFEQYWRTGGRKVQWISMSVAKSFTSALVGIAVRDGLIKSLDDPISKYAPKLSGTAYDGVRIKDVLQMSSGARWYEDYNDPKSEIFRLSAAMNAGGSFDEFMSTMERETTPGTLCKYNSADTQALGMLLAGATGRSTTDFMQEKLVEPLGMESSSYWMDDSRGGKWLPVDC